MLKNHLKIALRQIARNKAFSALNILGLSLGMALTILIALFIRSEKSYDNWLSDADRVYRVYRLKGNATAWTPPPLANKLAADYPEVAATAGHSPAGERLVTYAGNDLYVKETARIDSTFFEVMQLDFLYGNPKTAMDEPLSMVISDKLATQLFANTNPIGQVVQYNGGTDYIIRGVLDLKDKKTHINTDIFTRFNYHRTNWIGNDRGTYILLKPSANPDQLAAKMDADITALIRAEHASNNYTPSEDDFYRWKLQPLSEVYLHSEGWTSMGERVGSIRNLYIFGFIALLVLLVAIINYVNLTTARASQRSKEVGIRKVTGAGKGLLAAQFITESILQAVIASGFALVLVSIGLPIFNQVIDRDLQLWNAEVGGILVGTMILALVTGLLAGSYPAFVMTAFKPVTALKSNFLKTGENGLFRKVLVTGQFAVSITLLIVMAFIYRQVNFMLEKDLGFKPDQVISIPMNDDLTHYRVRSAKERLKQIPGVQEVTTASSMPGEMVPDWGMLLEGREEQIVPYNIYADADYAKVLDIEIVAGRFIDANIGADSINNFFVNETFVKQYNIESPIGQRLKWPNSANYGQIVGVIKDFHYRGVTEEIQPLVMMAGDWRNHVGIKLSTADLPTTIAAIKAVWQTIEPSHPMRYSFLDDDFAKQYESQQRFGQTILYATLLTLFIALLGLFGLTAFMVERRTKEIGIRKVLGASVAGLMGLMAKDFVQLIVFASIIAIPLGYALSNQWLADFAHRTDLVWWVFAGAGLSILLIGCLTVGAQSMKAALTNPVESLRGE